LKEFEAMTQYQTPLLTDVLSRDSSVDYGGGIDFMLAVVMHSRRFGGDLTHSVLARLENVDLEDAAQIMLMALDHPDLCLQQVLEHVEKALLGPGPAGEDTCKAPRYENSPLLNGLVEAGIGEGYCKGIAEGLSTGERELARKVLVRRYLEEFT
jgi:hypothetical protein